MRHLRFFEDFVEDSAGATAVEYGLIVSFIVIACMAAIHNLGTETSKLWTFVEQKSAKAHNGV